jgi:hypothetical protein
MKVLQIRLLGHITLGLRLGLLIGALVASTGIAVAAVPATPTNLEPFAINQTGLSLQWSANSNEPTEFRVEQKTLNGSFTDVIGALQAGAIITGLSRDTIYNLPRARRQR